MRLKALFSLAAALLASTPARAEPACLPAAVFKTGEASRPKLVLGFVDGQPTLCAQSENDAATSFGCWAVDAKTGALTAARTTWLPGHGRWVRLDASGCSEGYCIPVEVKPEQDHHALLATSTDAAHVAIHRDGVLHVFDAQARTETKRIGLYDQNAPPETSVGNMPLALLYAGDTIYVVGSDAGPFKAVWAFRQDGSRLGRINRDATPGGEPVNVYGGTVNLIDTSHIAVADAGTRTMLVLSLGDAGRTWLKRPVGSGPCSKQNMMDVSLGDVSQLARACKRFVQINYEPYFDIQPIRLPNGKFLTLLGGPAFGSIAILDGRTLVEQRRVKLRRCS